MTNKAKLDASNLSTSNTNSWRSKLNIGDWVNYYAELVNSTSSTTVDLSGIIPNYVSGAVYEILIGGQLENKSGDAGSHSSLRVYSDVVGSSSNKIPLTRSTAKQTSKTYATAGSLTIPVKQYLYIFPETVDSSNVWLYGYKRIK